MIDEIPVVAGGYDTEEIFESSLADKRITFEIEKNIAAGRRAEAKQAFTWFGAQRLKFQNVFSSGFKLNSCLLPYPSITLKRTT